MYLLIVDNGVIISIYETLKWNSFFSNFKSICGVNFERLEIAKQEFEDKKGHAIGGIDYIKIPEDPDFNKIYQYLVLYREKCNHKREDIKRRIKCIGEIDLKQLAYVIYLLEKNLTSKGFPKYLTEERILREFVKAYPNLKDYFGKIFCSTKDLIVCYCEKYNPLKKDYNEYIQILENRGRNLNHLPDPPKCFCCKRGKK